MKNSKINYIKIVLNGEEEVGLESLITYSLADYDDF